MAASALLVYNKMEVQSKTEMEIQTADSRCSEQKHQTALFSQRCPQSTACAYVRSR